MSLSVYLLTFNCAKEAIEPTILANSFFDGLPTVPIAKTSVPEIVAVSLQELAPLPESFIGGSWVEEYAPRLITALKIATAAITPDIEYQLIKYERVGTTALLVFGLPSITDERVQYLATAGVGIGQWSMAHKAAVGVRIGLVADIPKIEDTHDQDGSVQHTNLSVNITPTPVHELTFVAAHLAPREDGLERRNQDWKSIVQRLAFETSWIRRDSIENHVRDSLSSSTLAKPVDSTIIDGIIPEMIPLSEEQAPLLSHGQDAGDGTNRHSNIHTLRLVSSLYQSSLAEAASHTVFVFGDLNYRTSDVKAEADAHLQYPARPASFASLALGSNVTDDDIERDTAASAQFENLLNSDQLNRERRAGRTLHGFAEAPITFVPSYKYDEKTYWPRGLQGAVSESMDDTTIGTSTNSATSTTTVTTPYHDVHALLHWSKHRHPSWCDRILFNPPNSVTGLNYYILPVQPTSDHRPVVLFGMLTLQDGRASPGAEEDDDEESASEVSPISPSTTRTISRFPTLAPYEIDPDWRSIRSRGEKLELITGVLIWSVAATNGRICLGGAVGAIVLLMWWYR